MNNNRMKCNKLDKFFFIKTENTMEFEELKTYFLTIVVEVKLIGIAQLQFMGVFCT